MPQQQQLRRQRRNRICRYNIEDCLGCLIAFVFLMTLWMGEKLHSQHSSSSSSLSSISLSLSFQPSVPNILNQTTETTTSASYLWHTERHSKKLPLWMKDYFDWHVQQKQRLTPTNWNDTKQFRYLILRCYRIDERCGGVSDRLKPVPLMVLAAARAQRLLLIHWDRPSPLQEFLTVPKGGFSWTVPDWMSPQLLRLGQARQVLLLTRAQNLVNRTKDSSNWMVHAHIHDTRGGATQYDENFGPDAFAQVFHDLFRVFFEPAPALQGLIQQALHATTPTPTSTSTSINTSTILIPGDYSVAHYRAEYGREVARHPKLTEPSFLKRVALNALRCASELQATGTGTTRKPIYFASDNPIALETVRQLAIKLNYPILTFDRTEQVPLKLDDCTNITQPSDYYSTFVDLYLAGNGKCVTYGRGGFGRFASLLSFNVSCSKKHVERFFPSTCQGKPPFRVEATKDRGKKIEVEDKP
jgi:hypothetical protein